MTVKKMIGYREIWMGFAMLWIMFFHSGFAFSGKIVAIVKDLGYGGVDIFLFASGIGNYFSYTRDEQPLQFLKRRIMRLAPAYIPIIIVWIILNHYLWHLRPIFFIGNLLGIQAFSYGGDSFNWYLAALIVCYVLTPYLAPFIKEHGIKSCGGLIAVLILASTAFWTDDKFLITATRLPIYALGMIFAKYSNEEIKPIHILAGCLMFAVSSAALVCFYKFYPQYLWSYGFHWYPFIVIAPFLCFGISVAASITEHISIVSLFLDKCIKPFGKYSFEFYLVHVLIFVQLRNIWEAFEIEYPLNNWIWLLASLAVLVCVWILHSMSNQINKILRKICKD